MVWSCIKMHATYEIMNTRKGEITFRAWFGRASRCTLHTKSWISERVKSRSMRGLVVHQDARYTRNRECLKGWNHVPCVVWSCIKMHATHEIVNCASRLIIRAIRIVACNLLHEIVSIRKGWRFMCSTKSWMPERVKSRFMRGLVLK